MRRAICSLLSIMLWVKLKPLASIALTACSVTRLTSLTNSWLLLVSAASSPLDRSSTMRVISAARWPTVDEIARHLGADCKQRAFHLAGVLLEHVAHAGRHAADHALGVVRARADCGRGAGRELGQRTLGLGAVGLDRLAELLDAGADGAGGGGGEVTERALRLAGAGPDRAGQLLRARVDRLDRGRGQLFDRLRGVARIGPDR